MMRQESPSPNSSLSSSALAAAAKPPTPTSSPKLRRRTVSGGSDQSIVRQNLDIDGDEDPAADITVSPSASTAVPRPQPVVQDKRRSSAGAPEPSSAWREAQNAESGSSRNSGATGSPSRRSRGVSNSNKCVKRTQSLKEQLVNFFTQKNSAHSSASSPSASPTGGVDKLDMQKATVMPHGHAPVIRSSRRPTSNSRIPQYTGAPTGIVGVQGIGLSNGAAGPSNTPAGHDDGEAHASLYSARLFADEGSSDEHAPVSYDVQSSGHQLRVVKDPEASPFRSHPVDRCGVVVPSGPAPASSELPDRNGNSSSGRQGSPIAQDLAKKGAAPRVMDFERGINQSDLSQRWSRGGSMRYVQVLPDKKMRRDKNSSNENLASAVTDVPPDSSAAPGTISPAAFIPRPPIAKRPSTDSDENSAPEPVAAAAAAASNASLPPRRRSWMPKKKTQEQTSFPHQTRSSPIGIEGASSRGDFNLLVAAKPDDSSDAESLNDDCTSTTLVPATSDGSDTSPKGSQVGMNGGGTHSSLRPRSNSLEMLVTEKHTQPQIRQPQRRVRHNRMPDSGSAVPTGSPPKTVSWNLVPSVVNYDKEAHESSSSSSRRSHHRHHRHKSEINFAAGRGAPGKIRHAASDERIYDARKGIANSTLIAVHESFLEQMTNILKQEMELLEEVKQEKKSMTVYREVMQKILILKAQTVKQMQDILEQNDG